ncbi:MAG TPA: hypothetical protein PLC98_08265 [Anaerolineales bacterium]|nr:hypothetical protein [Anaerolineales bacterium]
MSLRRPFIRFLVVVLGLVCLQPPTGAQPAPVANALAGDCRPAGAEVAANALDEDCDGWLDAGQAFTLRATHPRVLLTPELLQTTIARMTGPAAREPYSRWFGLIKAREDANQDVDLVNLALIYKATGNATYLNRWLSRRPTSGDPGLDELYSVDILWNDVPASVKLNIMQRVSANSDIWYWDSINQSNRTPAEVGWGYHSAYGVARALAYAGAFAYSEMLSHPNVVAQPTVYNRFNTNNYLAIVDKELSPTGYFQRIENRVAGDPTYNSALPGSFGGMYDNIGYDISEEAHSVFVLAEFLMLTGQDRYSVMLHDKYRATFYQNLQVPHWADYAETDRWCRRAGTETHEIARIWYTRTGADQPNPDAVALTAWLYRDPRMQYYFSEARQRELCGAPYDGMYFDLIFHDDGLGSAAPSSNPTAMYFNGPGLVSMREDWSNDALFAVFVAGEGISRRYEDANSFILHRGVDLIPHAGARIRFDADNEQHHWYAVRSLSKNTLKIFDPLERFDIGAGGVVGALHTGPPLVPSDNFGGQLFETPISATDGCFSTDGCGSAVARNDCSAYPLGECEVADVTRFEHVPGLYTYSVGDGAAAYTRKIDYFEREFLYLRPDVVVVFDRVRSVDASYRKVWTIHTVPPASGSGTPTATDLGMRQYTNERAMTITDPQTVAYLDVLLPTQNTVTIRGGDTVLTQGQPLRPGQPIAGASILQTDIPRWLELFAVGGDVQGSLTLSGDAAEGVGVSEVITFDGTVQTYVTGSPTSKTTTSLRDTSRRWVTDQWAGYVLRLRGGPSGDVLITGNNADTLFVAGGYAPDQVWGYYILRPLENSSYHWQRITSITTTDMSVDNLILSVPHYFDAENAAGQLYSFAPHTDGAADSYGKDESLGQWTIEVEAAQPQLLDNFLNVFHVTDPGQPRVATQLVQGAGVSGAVIGDWLVLFANAPGALTNASVTVPATAGLKILALDLAPNVDYSYTVGAQTVTLSTASAGGLRVRSSAQGTVLIVQGPRLYLPSVRK